jgi:hypothetical protein
MPAPSGWIDRCRFHIKGNKIEILNWDKQGGFIVQPPNGGLPTNLPSELPRPINEMRRDDGDGEESPAAEIPGSLIPLSAACVKALGVPEYTGGAERWNKALIVMQNAEVTPEDVFMAVSTLRTSGKDYTLIGPQSILTAAINAASIRKTGGTMRSGNGNGKKFDSTRLLNGV